MSPIAATWCVLLVAAAAQARPGCAPAAVEALTAANQDAASGAYWAAAERLRLAAVEHGACTDLSVAAWGSQGWLAAVDAADAGGTEAALAPVRAAVEVLTRLGHPASPAAYAAAVLQAAAAAAQDERDEMALWLEHARDLARRLQTTGAPPGWPLAFDLAEAELWLRVDDFELAEQAYARALADQDSPAGWFGLARARTGRGETAGACAAYRRAAGASGVASDVASAAQRALERCPQ